jgi:hypothetical protein
MIGRPRFHRIEPLGPSALTGGHVSLGGAPEDARERACEWAQAVWNLYEADHDTVRTWLTQAGLDVRPRRRG